jgi:hypothetical protein
MQASQSTREGLVAHMQTASKSELMKRLHIAAALLGQYGEKHVKLLDTQSALREKHHRAEVGHAVSLTAHPMCLCVSRSAWLDSAARCVR